MVYIGVIILTILMSYIIEKTAIRNQENGTIRYRFGLIVGLIVLLSLFAAIRNEKVGVDINTYLKPPFDNVFKYDFISLLKTYSIEPFFGLIIYITANLFGNIHICMFVIQFVMLSFFFKFATYLSKKTKTSLVVYVLLYMLFCYFESFCIIRQHISLAILLCSLTFFDRKKYKVTFALFIVSLLFHYSSIAFIIVYILYYLRMIRVVKESEGKKKKKNIKYIILIILALLGYVVLFTNIHNILKFLINSHILPERYIFYVSSRVFAGNGLSTIIENGIMKWLLVSALLFIVLLRKKDNNYVLFRDMMVIVLFIQSFISIITTIGRLNIFYLYITFVSLANSYFQKDTKGKKDLVCKGVFILAVVIYFYYIIILDKCGYRVFPYYV